MPKGIGYPSSTLSSAVRSGTHSDPRRTKKTRKRKSMPVIRSPQQNQKFDKKTRPFSATGTAI